jgi:excisionase family DNA binding protein
MTPLLTREQVGKLLNVSLATIDRRCADGVLPFIKLGRRQVRFAPEDVIATIEKLRITSGALHRAKPPGRTRRADLDAIAAGQAGGET